MKLDRRRPVAVEDLLALKRAERPSPEFWADFDRQLRAKQLAALVEKRPWWREVSFADLFAGLKRYHLPLGATAVAALTIMAVRFGETETWVATKPVVSASVAAAAVVADLPVSSAVFGKPETAPVVSEPAVARASPEASVTPSVAPVGEFAAPGFSRFIPLLGAPVDEVSEFGSTAISRYVDSALVSNTAHDTVIYQTLLSANNRFDARVIPSAKPTVEPLHHITPPGERRGSRILTAMVSMASVESAMRTTERAASRLSEERLYDQIQRFGARGAGVNVRF